MSADPDEQTFGTRGIIYIECRKLADGLSEYLLSFGGDKDRMGAFYFVKATGFDALIVALRKLGVPAPDIATAIHVLMAKPRHKIPNVLLTQAMLRDLGL